APPSPDYIHGPEEPEQAPPSPDYVLGPEHADDEIVAVDQPYAEDASPISQSPEYVPESDFEAHPEDDDDEDPEEDPVDYPADGGDDGDAEEGLSEDDEDDDMDIEADEEEEHPAPADSVVVASTTADQAPSAEETEPFETDESAATPPPHPAYHMTTRISIPDPVPLPGWSDSEVVRLLAMSSPPASPLSPWSSPPPQIPFPPLPPILSPPSPPPSTSRREDRPEVTLPPRKKLGIALGPGYEVGESSSTAAARPAGGLRADYGFVATMDREIMRDPGREVAYGITDSWDEIKQMAPNGTTRSTADQETINATLVTNAQLQAMIDQGVTAALAARDALRSTNGDDNHNSRTVVRRTERATRECTYTDFLNATCTLHFVALTWWNTHVKTVGHEAAYGMPWKTLMKMMSEKYCPRNEIKKLEMELWDLKLKGTNLASYTQCYQELALLCRRMFSEESDKIERYIGGLLDMIHGSVVASKPKTMQEAIKIATELMDKKIRTFAERETASKRKFENTLRNTQNQQQQSNKRQNTGRVYTAAFGEKKQYGDLNPYALNAIITTMVHVLRSVSTATELAILPVTVGAVGRGGTDPDVNVVTGTRQIVISEMLRTDHRRSTEILGLRTALQGQVTALQGQVIALQAQVTALQGQQGLAGGPTQPELPEEAGSDS
nr:hypothetical protein [Tanacetum cinerariifolium]